MTDGPTNSAHKIPGEDVTAIFANFFHVHVSAETTRISFAEQVYGATEPQYRSAVVMTTSNAKALVDLLRRLIEETERKTQSSPQPS